MASKRAAPNDSPATPDIARRSKRLAKIVEEKPNDSASVSHSSTILSKKPMQEYRDSGSENEEFSDLVLDVDGDLYGPDPRLRQNLFNWHGNKTAEEDFDENMEEEVAENDDVDYFLNVAHISNTNERAKEEEKKINISSDILENGLKNMNLRLKFFESSNTGWLETVRP
ncbi:hypothetical protein TGAMA5MH_08425 [Trichoderma gamsii]|uniref:Uncharacterized protein n=1 Tax=Trichoderma gamsii TaxID=398673 RepID=A0A2K0T262_9HYPO|nr:hypothetical protein TGAMA5MH_08425 [Trichoderma gamsii]